MLIDQRRAHVRILYDRYMKQMSQSKSVTQKVLFPEVIEFSSSESVFVESVMENLVSLGFDLTNLGGRSYSINGIPEGCEGLSSVKLVHEIIDTAMQRGSVPDEVKKSIVLTMAKASAIVYGQALSEEEMVALVDELFTLESPNYTPDGKLILSVIKDNDIEKMFH
jgi:DNA mismatch repair protein MutL